MPQPSACTSAWISLFASDLSSRAFSTLRILPRSGRIAWKRRSRPCLAEPPAESPSTRYNSHFAGSRSEQSASLPGSVRLSSALLRITRSRALRAASRARLEVVHFSTIFLPSRGFFSSHSVSASATADSTWFLISLLSSLTLVCDSNCGSGSLTLMIAVRPSRVSSPVKLASASLSRFCRLAQSLMVRVSAARRPVRCVPPSGVLMVLAKANTDSL